MAGLLNVGSIALGLLAWILPISNMMRVKNSRNSKWFITSILSISACAVSLFFQIIYNNHLVKTEDWSALMDTRSAVVFASGVLLVVTLMLNLVNRKVILNSLKYNRGM
ncbi:MAG TPA: hypothetical protein DCG34_00660 [Clostridiales bacterium]|jgi:cytochrome c oxidase subunit 4|nr:hypothetical protein [Clostridiales bacterium]